MHEATMEFIQSLIPRDRDMEENPKYREDYIKNLQDILLNAFHFNYSVVMKELKQIFTSGELKCILDVMNGSNMLVFEHPDAPGSAMFGQMVVPNVEDSLRLYPGEYEQKWEFKKDEMLSKVGSLSRFQSCCLELWAAIFWNDPNGIDVNDYVS